MKLNIPSSMPEFQNLDARIDEEKFVVTRDACHSLLNALSLNSDEVDSLFQAGYTFEFIYESIKANTQETFEVILDNGVISNSIYEACRYYDFVTGTHCFFYKYPHFFDYRTCYKEELNLLTSLNAILSRLQYNNYIDRSAFRCDLQQIPSSKLRDLEALRILTGIFEPYQLKVINEECSPYVQNVLYKMNDSTVNSILRSHLADYLDD